MTDGNSLMIGGLAVIALLTCYGIAVGNEKPKDTSTSSKSGDQKVTLPAPKLPPSIRHEVEREFNELRDMLNVLVFPQHHRFLEITKLHIFTLLEGYEKKCLEAMREYGKEIEVLKNKDTKSG